ncbi:MAG: SDR family NAD(P)-dependent oxidoreductase [Cyanobacteria bacterium SBLK]|nr:SDR family NAD(P)-dependent oxidoreductase [Cyanobacteria bacterium SBLK]
MKTLQGYTLKPSLLAGKTALITGASRGIGKAIALEFARQGVRRLLLVARNRDRLNTVATEIQEIAPEVEAIAIPVDLTDTSEVSIAMAKAWRDFGPIQFLVNNAGVAHQTSFLSSQPHQAEKELHVNLLGMYTVTRLIARRMAAKQEGTIVNVSSLMGKIAAPSFATYSATKFAIVGFTQALRSELSPKNVRVVSLLPSLTDTDMVRNTEFFKWVAPTTPERVAKALVTGLNRGENEIFVDWQSKISAIASGTVPWLMEKVVSLAAPRSESQPNAKPGYSLGSA